MRRTLGILLAVTVAGLTLAAPASAVPVPASVEAEAGTVRVLSGRSSVYADPAASAGRARVMVTNGTVSAVVGAGSTADRLLLRLRGDQAAGAPRAVVTVDGRQVGVLSVASRTWTEHAVAGSWAPGAHTVTVRFPNDARTATADRNLRLDRFRFVAAPAAPAVDDAYEARVVQLVNAARTSHGLRPLAVSACADRYAEAWGAHLAVLRTLVHRTDLAALLSTCGGSRVGENIAYGGITADRLVQMWLDSPGHRANILGDYTHVGTGATRAADGTVFAAQNFLRL